MKKIFHKNEIQEVARKILANNNVESVKAKVNATVIALSGDLGAGKTTLTQAIARELNAAGNIISPTFVIMKNYHISKGGYKNLVHIDAYRLDSHKELSKLGWAEIISNPENLVLIEWPEKVSEIIPNSAYKIFLSHESEDLRTIEY